MPVVVRPARPSRCSLTCITRTCGPAVFDLGGWGFKATEERARPEFANGSKSVGRMLRCSVNSRAEAHSAPRAFRSGTLDMLIRPVNGRLSSNIKKIPHVADKANRTRQVKTVTFGGENRLKLANMIMSQNASTDRNGIGTRFSDSTNSRNRTCARSLLICTARDWSERWRSSCGDSL